MAAIIKRIADFLNVTYSVEEEAQLLDHLSFSSMKSNKSVNFDEELEAFGIKPKDGLAFLRKGDVGGWRNLMCQEMIKIFDKWTHKNLEGTDFPREYVEN